jgi:hypothetical protein
MIFQYLLENVNLNLISENKFLISEKNQFLLLKKI